MDPETIFRTLAEEGVEFVLVGGLAATVYGATLGTFDIDLCFRQIDANCDRLSSALESLEAETFPLRQPPIPLTAHLLLDLRMLHLKTPAGRLDLFAEIPGLGRYEDLVGETESIDFEGSEIRILSLDQLIRAKSALSTRKDRQQLDQLRALKKLRSGC